MWLRKIASGGGRPITKNKIESEGGDGGHNKSETTWSATGICINFAAANWRKRYGRDGPNGHQLGMVRWCSIPG